MSSATSAYAESVASCRPSTPLLRSPPPAGDTLPRLPDRRRLDFPTGGGLDDEDDDDFLCRAAEEMERSHYEVKRRAAQGQAPPAPAPPALREKQCICGRGPCDVVWKERGGWAYVCSAPPLMKRAFPLFYCSWFSWKGKFQCRLKGRCGGGFLGVLCSGCGDNAWI